MIVLHGNWTGDRFHLWGERLGGGHSDTQSVSAGAGGWGASGCPHPFALSALELHASLGEMSPDGLLASVARDALLDVWLPAFGGLPLSSMEERVVCEGEHARPFDLASFRVPTLELKSSDAIDLLSSLPSPAPRSCGDALRYWMLLARRLFSLLSRGQFIPDAAFDDPQGASARWRLTIRDEGELEWLQRYAEAMPPSCRAMVSAGSAPPDPVWLVESFLQECADVVIRRVLEEDPFFHQIHERAAGDVPWEVRWLSALIGDHRELAGPPEESDMVGSLRNWLGRVDDTRGEVPARLCFELLEPDNLDSPSPEAGEEHERWRIAFRLELLESPGKLHDLADVWEENGKPSAVLRRHPTTQREHLLAEIARAIEVCPTLEGALKNDWPTGVDVGATEAFTFIRNGSPLLEARGFGVFLPEWAQKRERRLGLRLRISPTATPHPTGAVAAAGLGLGSLVDFEWQVAVGDTNLTIEQFDELRASKSPLVRLHHEWVFLETEAAETAAQFLAEQRQGQMTLGQALRTAAGFEEVDAGLPVSAVSGSEWIERLLRGAGGVALEKHEQPDNFKGTMRPYQLRGLAWLVFMERAGLGACLADDMGLGKTIQLIALLLIERKRNGDTPTGPTLVFAPMSVVGNWQRELQRFAPSLSVVVHHGPDRLTGDAFVTAARKTDVVVTTYALGHRDLNTLNRIAWHRIALDEAQKIKNPSAAQTIAIRSLPSTYRVALTGTPLENHLSELWSIMEMLNPGLLGSAGDFRKRFAVPIERLGDAERGKQLRRTIHPFILRRIKSDPEVECDLPEKMEMRVFCNLTAEQAALYEQIVATSLSEIEQAAGIRRRGVILATLTKLKQVCNHPAHFLRDDGGLDDRSGKCERLVEMLEEVLAEDDAALVFTQFRKMGDLLVRLITERLHAEVMFLHGGTSAKQRQAMIDRFQDPDGGVRIFLLSLRAGGLGLNLTAANHVFHFDRWWNPAVEAQATDRVYRIGQTRRVQVHKFVCIGTIEDRIDRMLAEKTALMEQIVGTGDAWLTGLSTDELRNYLTLSPEAVG